MEVSKVGASFEFECAPLKQLGGGCLSHLSSPRQRCQAKDRMFNLRSSNGIGIDVSAGRLYISGHAGTQSGRQPRIQNRGGDQYDFILHRTGRLDHYTSLAAQTTQNHI